MNRLILYMTFNTIRNWFTAALLALLSIAFLVIAGDGIARAQSVTTSFVQPQQASCIAPIYNLRIGSQDYYTGGAVTQLQNFLVTQGYFNSAYLGSGRYGFITAQAVVQLQAAYGLPATGYYGPLTRALVQQLSCGSNPVPPTIQSPGISSLSPTSGPVGTQLTIAGYDFTANNSVLIDGMVVASNVPAQSTGLVCIKYPCSGSQIITFSVPEYVSPYCAPGMYCAMMVRQLTLGVHQITVQNSNGTSNTATFTVTSGTTNIQPLSITGLSAPASLPLGTPGMWSVQALSSGAGNLHYSVVWGDENIMASGIMAPQNTSIQSSATFTHAYSRAGNFTPVFTVTDDFGHSVSASNTVVVTPLY